MVDERQPRIVAGVPRERDARRGLPDGVSEDAVVAGPVVHRLGDDGLVVVLLAPGDAPPVAITTRARRDGDGVDAVFQPTILRGERAPVTPWHYVLRMPSPVDPGVPVAVRIRGLDDEHEVVAPPAR